MTVRLPVMLTPHHQLFRRQYEADKVPEPLKRRRQGLFPEWVPDVLI